MARRSGVIKVVAGLAAFAALGVLFLRSAQSARETPFAVERSSLAPWVLSLEPDPLGSWLSLRPPASLAPPLGREIFARGGESVNYPNPASMPLVLQAEFDRALAPASLTPAAVMTLAQAAGLESAAFEPRCMAQRRVSEPGSTRGISFVLFDSPAFNRFRQQIAEEVQRAGGPASLYDPAALSPVLVVAALDDQFGRWMPLRANPDVDCAAPIEVQ